MNSKNETQMPKKRFHIILIKPSKYDDDGYVIRWALGVIMSNSLACLYALAKDVADRGCLGPEVEPVLHILDETVQKIPVQRFRRQILDKGEKAVVCMVGVQTNQFARAVDLSLEFKKEGFQCMIGGFHVSGCLEMLPKIPAEIQEAMACGITIVAGEVEQRMEELLKDALEGRLKPIYNFVKDKPSLVGVPGPFLPNSVANRFLNRQVGFDAGRGCPFHCTFCTIINIQGNTMRGRSADDIEKIVRAQHAQGNTQFFITDDNFARHPEWERIADRLIDLKENQGIRLSLKIQTDTAAHKIPRFIEKVTHAGVRRVFMGMESVNPVNLKAAGKHQNQLKEYRKMLQMWRDHGAVTYAGYILGFPDDTYESIMRDVEFLKKETPLELPEFFILTPLPGSKDHQRYVLDQIPLEADTNLYDTAHVCVDHPKMNRAELMRAYQDAWKSFYSKEHMRTLIFRRKGPRRRILIDALVWFCSAMFLEKVHPLLSGFGRLKGRKSRRRGMPIEPVIPYYSGRIKETVGTVVGLLRMVWEFRQMKREAERPGNVDYIDLATTPEKS